ncbi:MAG: PIN domain-containing protein [Candidatus Riflebacteria bacterium]|nr:PIN domain-containing protein [Candidatus Riflebacteria bacterium]
MKKRVLFDTNIILDFLLERQPFFSESTIALNIASQGKVSGFVSAHAISTLFYVLSKKISTEKSKEVISELLNTLSVAPVTGKVIKQAVDSKFKDFEDAVSYYSAFEEKVSIIVSRNVKDFSKSDIPVMLPEVFISNILYSSASAGTKLEN